MRQEKQVSDSHSKSQAVTSWHLGLYPAAGAICGVVSYLDYAGSGLWVGFCLLLAACILTLTRRTEFGRLMLGLTLAALMFNVPGLLWMVCKLRGGPMVVARADWLIWGHLLFAGAGFSVLFIVVGAAHGLASRFWPPLPAEPRCATCGYLLIGLPEPRCPECGTPFDPASEVAEPMTRPPTD